MYSTLIDHQTLQRHYQQADWIVVDCRFSLADTDAGIAGYRKGHIPGAVYAHLDDDLSGPPVTDSGRHPLPTPEALKALFGRLGITSGRQVVAYDDANGVIASRLWWMLRYMGHEAAAVLDGGWQAWQDAGYPTRSGMEHNAPAVFEGEPRSELLVQLADLEALPLLVDSRSGDRYRGLEEPIDPVAGHIPGAVNLFYQSHWTEGGRYVDAAEMRRQLEGVLGEVEPREATFYCGSGVSACVNLLAMVHSGLGDGRLYVGSWSEWVRDSERPIATTGR